jgi:hypothetical protein
MEKSPDQIVADIDRKQNEEDKDLIPRAGRMLKEKFMKLMTSEPKEGKEKEKKPVSKAKGGMIKSSASKRADGCAIRGKTRA